MSEVSQIETRAGRAFRYAVGTGGAGVNCPILAFGIPTNFRTFKNMNRSIVELRQLDERQLPTMTIRIVGGIFRLQSSIPGWMRSFPRRRILNRRPPCDIGRATIDALRSLEANNGRLKTLPDDY